MKKIALVISRMVQALEAEKAACPIRQKMLGLGANPDDGWVLMMPSKHKQEGAYYPDYVKFSPHIEDGIILNMKALLP